MGYFTDGYTQGEKIQKSESSMEEHSEILKNLLKNAKYNECVEWYNGFYKAMLDYDLARLKMAFVEMKNEAEKGKKNKNE